jgi:hypothetical protein
MKEFNCRGFGDQETASVNYLHSDKLNQNTLIELSFSFFSYAIQDESKALRQ